jgi:WD40 repeat protein
MISAFAAAVCTAEPPTEPILRIETGMHTAKIGRIGVDDENRYIVTASEDKTVRLWELSTGRLIRIFRPPVGVGNEGKIYSVALSPDGNTIACGGWTQYENGSFQAVDYFIYLFDRQSGGVIRRISGLPNVINQLAFSRNGGFLVATMGRSNGIRVYRSSDYQQVAIDEDYGDNSYGADFDGQGRLITASYDGYVRLYSSSFKLLAKMKTPGGNKPFAVRFSPDGAKAAVGFVDSTKVDVLSGNDLSYLFSPDTAGVNNGSLFTVSWSSDGRSLYAGGQYTSDGTPIVKWSEGGRGARRNLNAANSTIMHILPLKSGGIVFSSYDPAFGIINGSDQRTLFKAPSTPDYRDNQQGLLLSYDGSSVQFAYELWGKSPARISVSEGLLTTQLEATNSQLAAPVFSAPGMDITNWKYTYGPKLNGAELKLKPYEWSTSIAVAPNGESFLHGSLWNLRLFDRTGAEKWIVPAPGVVWGVNVSGNGKVAVAACGDGTVRWYRMTDGKELLAFFPHIDKKRWVLWTPSGYYIASPGGEDLIGWHINNGKDAAADFFPASRFRDRFYRPDVTAKILGTFDESEAVRLANEESGRRQQEASIKQALPPVVSIVSPSDGAVVSNSQLTVKFTVRTPSGEPVTSVKALVDGRPVAAERGVTITPKDAEQREISITVPEQNTEVSIIAENRFAASEPATIRVKWRGKKLQDEFVIKPKLYVLSVGVSKYRNPELTLGLAAKDAKDFAATMQKQQGGLYREVTTKVLTDEKATKDDILDGLDWLQRQTTSKDVAMIFLSGHGVNDQNGIYYYLPVNADIEKLKRTGVPFSDVKNTVASLAGKTVFFVDTCHSGSVMGTRRGLTDITAMVNELSSAENGAVVFASSTGGQYSLEKPEWGNGAFTKALIEGMSGKADYTGKGKISINMLDLYLSERVKELTKGKQTPTTTKPSTVPDFPVAVKNQ